MGTVASGVWMEFVVNVVPTEAGFMPALTVQKKTDDVRTKLLIACAAIERAERGVSMPDSLS
jgi:hypothetical protein